MTASEPAVSGIAYVAGRYSVDEVDRSDDPAAFLTVFNSNPEFLDASTLHTGVVEFSEDDVREFLWQNAVMEDSHCLVVRSGGKVVGTITVLTPHPRERQPWIGAVIIDTEVGFERVATPVVSGLERLLTGRGWSSVSVAPMVSQRKTVAWWREQGYEPVERRLDNDKREVEVHRKALGAAP